MPNARARIDDEFTARNMFPESPEMPSTSPPMESTCLEEIGYAEEANLKLNPQNEGDLSRHSSTWSGQFIESLERVSTRSKRPINPRPSTPPNKIIPPYGLFPRDTRPSTPPTSSQTPSLCGSSIPSANTTPEGLIKLVPWRSGSLDPDPNLPVKPFPVDDSSDDEDASMDGHQGVLIPTGPHDEENSPGATVSDSETWAGSSSSSEDEETVLLPQFDQFLGPLVRGLYTHFQDWKKNTAHQAAGERQDTHQSDTKSSFTDTVVSSTQPKGENINKLTRKRRSEDEDGGQPSKLPRLDLGQEDQDTRLLACPFAKKNPIQHRKCFKYVLQEVARLKQHLPRVHQVPIHCARCSKVFDTTEERDHHSRQPDCVVQPPQVFDGINESQRRQLGKRISSKKSREENWYLIYHILFPEAARPESPYIEDNCLSEEVFAIREFAAQAAPARITAFANDHLTLHLRSNRQQVEQFAQAAVRDVFDMILESWDSSCQSGQSSTESTPHRSTSGGSSIGHDSGYSTTGPPSGSSGYSSGGASGVNVLEDSPMPRLAFGPVRRQGGI